MARLDRLNLALAPGIRSGDPRAVKAAVRLMERRAKLFGLDATRHLDITGALEVTWKPAQP